MSYNNTCCASRQTALICAIIGVLGPARTLGATTMMTTEGAKRSIPQGRLSGDRANLIAWIKVRQRTDGGGWRGMEGGGGAWAVMVMVVAPPPPQRSPATFALTGAHAPPLSAWLQVIGPLVYGSLYVRGVAAGVPTAPFRFNAALTLASLVLAPIALGHAEAAAAASTEGGKKGRSRRWL